MATTGNRVTKRELKDKEEVVLAELDTFLKEMRLAGYKVTNREPGRRRWSSLISIKVPGRKRNENDWGIGVWVEGPHVRVSYEKRHDPWTGSLNHKDFEDMEVLEEWLREKVIRFENGDYKDD